MAAIRPLTAAGVVVAGLAASAGLQQTSPVGGTQSQAQIAALLQDLRSTPPVPVAASAANGPSPAAPATGGSATTAASSAASSVSLTQIGGRVRIMAVGGPHFEYDSKSGIYRTLLFLQNAGQEKEHVTFEVPTRDPKEQTRPLEISPKSIDLEPSALTTVPLQLKLSKPEDCSAGSGETGPFFLTIPSVSACYPLVAVVMVRNQQIPEEGKKPDPRESTPVAVSLQAPPANEMQSQILLRSCWLAVFCVLLGSTWAAYEGRGPGAPVTGSPDWEFGKSWSANATLFMGLLTALLGFGGLPAQTVILPKNSYLILSLLAVSMVGIGPIVYASIQRKTLPAKGVESARQGILGTLYLAGWIVLWSAYVQFALVWLIFAELARAGVMTQATISVLDWMLIALAIILFVYGVGSLRLIAAETKPKDPKLAGENMEAMGFAPVAAEPPKWHLL